MSRKEKIRNINRAVVAAWLAGRISTDDALATSVGLTLDDLETARNENENQSKGGPQA